MNYRILIDGMGCANCEVRIRTALEGLPGITVLNISRAESRALISTETELSPGALYDAVKNAREDGKYTVTGIEAVDEAVDEDEAPACCSGKHKDRDEKERQDLMNRLKRIEGQVRGIEKMLDNNCYCTDIITQVAAANAALNSFNKVLLGNHMRTCVADNIRNGNDDVIDELVALLQKLMK